MEWTDSLQQELHRFLAGFTNPDPQVQASNLQQLKALAQYPHALLAVCDVACDNSCSPSVRLSATTVGRQLLQRQEDISYYLSSTTYPQDTQTTLLPLVSALLNLSFQPVSSAFPGALQRATVNLLVTLLRAMALDTTLFRAATEVWSHLLTHVLRTTARDISQPVLNNDSRSQQYEPSAQAAALLREMCEVALTESGPLREWVGGQPQHTLDLCTAFSQQLECLQFAVNSHLSLHPDNLSSTHALATWVENFLGAFSSCMSSGVLPSTTPHFLENGGAESNEGPAVQALRVVSTAVVQIHEGIQSMILNRILKSLQLWDGRAGTPIGDTDLQQFLRTLASFIAVTMHYMADAIFIESFDVLNGCFQREALPLLSMFCRGVVCAQLVYDSASESSSVHAAVAACVTYTAQLVHVENFLGLPPQHSKDTPDRQAITDLYMACVHRMLVSAATLPISIAEQLNEHTVQDPDSAAEMLIKSAATRRRGKHGPHTSDASKYTEMIASNHNNDDHDHGGVIEEDAEAEHFAMADLLEAQLPDNGTLRQAVAWCANTLTCNAEWLAALLPIVIASPSPPPPPVQLSDACAMEAALFVCNETIDSALADKSVSDMNMDSGNAAGAVFCEQLAASLRSVLHCLPASSCAIPSGGRTVPFYLRIQAVRFLGRLGNGLMDPWKGLSEGERKGNHSELRAQWLAQRTYSALSPAGGLEGMLWTLTQVLNTEVNKSVQVECVRVATSLMTNCIRILETLCNTAETRLTNYESDLEEESLDDDDDSSVRSDDNRRDDRLKNDPSPGTRAEMVNIHLFCKSLSLTPGLAAFPQTLQILMQSFPHLQWSVRQSIYHLLSEVLPPLWGLTKRQHEQPSLEPWAYGDTSAAAATRSLVRAVTAQSFEVLAAHYMALLTDVRSSLFEMASLLSCMADVATGTDAAALETMLPWILQVAHHVLNRYADYLTNTNGDDSGFKSSFNASSTSSHDPVDMTDMCMVSLDLISCVCDSLIDRDALLACQLCSQMQTEAAAMDTRLMALAAALLNPTADNTDATLNSALPKDALPNRCVALLNLCQSRPEHPSRRTRGIEKDAVHTLDEFGEVRRACFAILYDCVFLLAYPRSLFRTPGALERSTASAHGIIDELGKNLFVLCLREVVAGGIIDLETLQIPPSPGELMAASTQNAAVSDAWLCLGALLILWDQQCWWAQKQKVLEAGARGNDHHNTVEHFPAIGPVSLLPSTINVNALQRTDYLHHLFENLLTLLADKNFVAVSYLKLNMTSTACGLATLLASRSSIDTALSQSILSCETLVRLFSVVSSTRIREYAPDASSGEMSGVSEASQILWCLGRVWQSAVQPLPHDALDAFLRAQGKDIAKTAVWLQRCVKVHGTAFSSSSCSLWASLLELWCPIAETLVQASQAGVFPLTLTQSSALRQLADL